LTAYNINFTNTITSNGLPFSGGGGTLSATSSFAQVALPLSSSRGICFDPSGNTYVFNTGNSVIFKITPQGVTSLFAGSVSGWADGIGSAARLNTLGGQICYDSYTNCIAVADVTAVRLITLAGNVITMAGNGSTGNGTTPVSGSLFFRLTGICSDGSGNLYIVDATNNNIKKITLNSPTPTQYGCTVANVAGSLSGAAGYTNATGASALFNNPFNIVINTAKTFLYVCETNNRVIRSISLPGNVVGTLAGALSSPTAGTTDSTTPTSVQFNFPIGLAIDGSGVYVSDYLANNIRYINISPFYTVTLAGQPANVLSLSGVGTNAQIYRPLGISLDSYGNPWISTDSGCVFNYTMATGYLNLFYQPTASNLLPNSIQNTSISSIVVPAMATETIFGAGFTAFNSVVSYVSPQGLIMDSQNNLFVSDKFKIRKVAVSGFVTSIFGDPANIQNNNFPYPGAEGQYNGSYQMCFDNSGNIYIADPGFSVIHIVNTRTGAVTNLAITGQALNNCYGVIFNAGTLYVSNTNILASPPAGYLVSINLSTGVSTLIAGSTTLGAFTNATGTAARFNYIYGICFDVAKANILICDRGNTAIRNYNISTGAVTTYSTGVVFPSFIASDSLGNYYATSGSALYKIVGGTATTFSTGFTYVLGVTIDSYNNIYVSDIVNNCIYFINPAGTLSTYSGTAGLTGTQDSLYASSLTLLAPYVGINKSNAQYTLDVAGSVNFSGSLFNNGVVFAGGSISTFSTLTAYTINFTSSITSNGLPFSGGGGTLSATSSFAQIATGQLPLSSSVGVAFDPSGNMYVGDYNNYVIYKITSQGVISLFAGTHGISGLVDGIGSAALFTTIWQPYYDPYTGTLLVPTSGSIRSINLTTRQVTTVIGSATLGNATSASSGSATICFGYLPSICGDGSGNYYVTDGAYTCIKKVIIPQVVTQYCGSMTLVCGSANITGYYNGTGTAATFNVPRMITINAAKTFLYVADNGNNVIRAISLPSYVVTTLAGATSGTGWSASTLGNTTAAPSGATDSTTATSVRFNGPHGICIDSGNLLVTESGGNRLRYINTTSFYTATMAGSIAGSLGGTGANSQMNAPGSITLDPTGSPWIVTYGSPAIFNYNLATGYLNLFFRGTTTTPTPYSLQNTAISTVMVPAMATSVLFGSGFTAFNANVSYVSPQGLIMDSQNNLFVSDKYKIRKITPSGFTTSVFGDPSNIEDSNQPFPGTKGQYNGSYQMCFDNDTMYIADAGLSTIHIVNTVTGAVTNLSVTGQALNNCFGVLFNAGTLYVSNTNILASPPAGYLVSINLSTGVSTRIAGSSTIGAFTNGTGTAARFNFIYGICFDVAKANILICDRGNTLIRNYNISTGAVTTYSTGVAFPSFIASDSLGNYYATSGTVLYKIVGGTATSFSAGFSYVLGVTIDTYNNIYVSDVINNTIYFISPEGLLTLYSGSGATGTQDSLYASTISLLTPYVGINKSNAQYTLDVAGSVNFSGGLFSNGVIFAGIGPNISSLSTIGTAAFFSSVQIQGSLSVFSSINANSMTATSINANSMMATSLVSQNLTATSGFAKISAGQLPLLNSRGICFDGSGNMYVSDTTKYVIFKITPQGVVSLFAGNYGINANVDGVGTAACFKELWNMCFDSYSGWIIICTIPCIRAMNPTTGQVITLCGSTTLGNAAGTGAAASFQAPLGVCSDGAGNLYVADNVNNNICKVSFSVPITVNGGTKSIIAGPTTVPLGASGYYNNATGTSATFNGPRSLAINSSRTLLWVIDHVNQVVRQVSLTAPYAVTTYAGAVGSSGTPGNTTAATVGHTDSTTPGSVQFYNPHGIAIDASNNLYIAEYTFCFLRYINTNTFFTLSLAGDNGNINTEGVGANGQMAGPTAVALDSTGSPWVVTYNAPAIFNYNVKTGYLSIYWRPAGGNAFSAYSVQNTAISTIAMPGITTANIYGSGFTTFNQQVTYTFPAGVQMDSQNNLYVSDQFKIRKVTPSGFVTSVYADPSNTQSNNLPGTGTLAEFGRTYQFCFDTSGNMFFADTNLHYIYRLNLATQTAIALPISAPTTGLANQGLCMWIPIGIVYNNNILYVANRGNTGPYINTVNLLTNVITLIAGTPGSAAGDVDNATGTSAKFNQPTGICFDASKNNIFVCDSGNNKVRVVNLSGSYAVTTLTPTSGTITLSSPIYIAMDSLYNLYVTNFTAPVAVIKIPYGGTYPTQTITYGPSSSFAAGFANIQGITVDSYNYVYVADTTNKLIYRISPTGSTDIYSGLHLVTGTQDSKYASSITLMAPYVGVGTSNPQAALQVVGSNVITPGLYMPTIYPDVFFSLLNYCPYGTSARTMMEIGSTYTGIGGFGTTYKYLMGYSNSAGGVGSYIIQSVNTTNPSVGYNITATPITLLTLNNTGMTVAGTTFTTSLQINGTGWNILDASGGIRMLFNPNADTRMYTPTFFSWDTGANTSMMKINSNALDNGNPYWLAVGSNHTATCSLDVKGAGKFVGDLNVGKSLYVTYSFYSQLLDNGYWGIASVTDNVSRIGFYNASGTAFNVPTGNGYSFRVNGVTVATIGPTGVYTVASDSRVKKNIKPATDTLDIINNLTFVSFDYIDSTKTSVKHGLIAQEVQKIYPDAVNTNRSLLPTHLEIVDFDLEPSNTVLIKCHLPHGLVVNDEVKLDIDNNFSYKTILEVPSETSFLVNAWDNFSPTSSVSLYGKQVDDFLSIDKQQIGILAAGACQTLSGQVTAQASTIRGLQTTIAEILARLT
jgi:hypothetical protein